VTEPVLVGEPVQLELELKLREVKVAEGPLVKTLMKPSVNVVCAESPEAIPVAVKVNVTPRW
jgi:hypothetical protein